MAKKVMVFSGYNQRAVIAFLRTLDKLEVDFSIIASSKEDLIFQTSYAESVIAVRDKKQLDIDDIIQKIKLVQHVTKNQNLIIAPSTEALNRFVLENRKVFEAIGCEIPLVRKDLYEQISDKLSFGKLCTLYGINTPNEYAKIEDAPLPFVAKPKTYFSSGGQVYYPVIIQNENDKIEFLGTYDKADFYYQDFIDGDSLYLLYSFGKDGDLRKFSQQNFVQQPGGKSMIAARSSTFHDTLESHKYEKLFHSVGFEGLVMVEVKGGPSGYYMIEANPRFWGPSQLFVDAECDLFEHFLYNLGVVRVADGVRSNKTYDYFWYGGYIQAKSSGQIAYHTYSEEEFIKDLPQWKLSDVYNRADTQEIYNIELEVSA